MREKGIVLRDITNTPLLRWEVELASAIVERLAIEYNATSVGLYSASESLKREAFPGSGGAEENNEPAFYSKVYVQPKAVKGFL
jgi:hypothetical protein